MEESDPTVLKELRTSSDVQPLSTHPDLENFIQQVCDQPMVPACARLKKGAIKKVLQALMVLVLLSFWFVIHTNM